ncbi:MAG: hypothetical protein ACOX8R_02450 [Bacillota bacterium]|jgi:hypothetical protein
MSGTTADMTIVNKKNGGNALLLDGVEIPALIDFGLAPKYDRYVLTMNCLVSRKIKAVNEEDL